MPKTIQTEVFTYDELSPEAQETARDAARARGWYGDAWSNEWRASLDKASDAIGLRVRDWSVDPFGGRSYVSGVGTGYDYKVDELQGVRAWKWLARNVAPAIGAEGDCPFTGYASDESLLAPLRAFLARPNLTDTVRDVLAACATAWAKAWAEDMVDQHSDEYVADDLTANEYEFTADGSFWN